MENDSLKSAWQRMATQDKSSKELKTIIKERGHSMLSKIRRQLIIEVIGAAVFLIVYYDFFDGDKKPLYANVFFGAALFFMICHNIVMFMQFRSSIKGENIDQLLRDRLYKMKIYAITSALLRLVLASSFLMFFVSAMKFTPVMYWLLSGAILMFMVQLGAFIRLWRGRIGRMKEVIEGLHS